MYHTYREISTQSTAWASALQVLEAQADNLRRLWQGHDSLIFTGCGSTHYLALSAASFAQSQLRVYARGVPASELLLHPESVFVPGKRPLLVTVSRSAATTETVEAARQFRAIYGDQSVLALSCYDDQPLNAEAALTLAVPEAQEVSLAQTRSFASMLLLAEGTARILAGESLTAWLTDAAGQLVEAAEAQAKSLADLSRFDRYYYLGSGPRYGLACEAMLKLTEMSQTFSSAYHPMEFRHGPKAMVNKHTLVVGLLGQEDAYESNVLADMRALGAATVEISPRTEADFKIPAALPLVYYMPLLQWIAYHRSVAKDLNPDQPQNLDMVVRL
jgi:glucosamine--fructose-6-phosphate aminotransferase (isomerizing)